MWLQYVHADRYRTQRDKIMRSLSVCGRFGNIIKKFEKSCVGDQKNYYSLKINVRCFLLISNEVWTHYLQNYP